MTAQLTPFYVFLFSFAVGYLLAGRRTILTVWTRTVLIALCIGCLAYGMAASHIAREIIAFTCMMGNIVFLIFAGLDFMEWQRRTD